MEMFKEHIKPDSNEVELARKQLTSQSFVYIKNIFSTSKIKQMTDEIYHLIEGEFAQNVGPLKMHEEAHGDTICRMEYIVGASPLFSEFIEKELEPLINNILGKPMQLLKDKCNFKKPGGGGFGPHQDYLAYKAFYNGVHYTVAVYLDDTTKENGALEFMKSANDIEDYRKFEKVPTFFSNWPVFPIETEGNKAGEIVAKVTETFDWSLVCAGASDIVLFDSLVPHRSAKNVSENDRTVLFFTFVEAAENKGVYEKYYAAKRANPNDPQFHIATPMKKPHG